MFSNYLHLNSKEQKTFSLHFFYSLIEGSIMGILLMNEFVFIKSLQGTNTQLAFLAQFTMTFFIVTICINEFLNRVQNKTCLLLVAAFITRGPLLLLLLFPKNVAGLETGLPYHYIFLAIFFVFYFADPVILPTINHLLKNNYRYFNFGKLYGYATAARKFGELFSVILFGIALEKNPYIFTYIYPIIGVLGVLSIFLLSRIQYENIAIVSPSGGYGEVIRVSIKRMFHIIKTNKPYRDFEIGFMCYGIGFMLTLTVIAIYFAKELDLNFFSLGIYKNIYNIITIALLPVLGRVIGTIDPRKFAIYTYFSIILYIGSIALTSYFPFYVVIWGFKMYVTLIFAFVFFGVFGATMQLLWSIGSSYFCQDNEAGQYQSIHMTLTGVRGCFAPLFGVQLLAYLGYQPVFALSLIILLIGIAVMIFSLRFHRETIQV